MQYGHTTLRIVEKTSRFTVRLVSEMDTGLAATLGFIPTPTADEVLDGWALYHARDLLAVVHESVDSYLAEVRLKDGKTKILIEPGDYVVLHDTGAYYFSNPFFYNALPAPAVYGAELNTDGSARLDCWRQQQSMDDMLAVIG